MSVHTKVTLFNDPIYGFIAIETPLIFQLIEHPYFQRLRRIAQMGLSSLVYPGAHHTRFEHALGAMHIMQRAIAVLHAKGVAISEAESEAMQVAILLHDIGHGPFSHATEKSLIQGIAHESISIQIMESLNTEFNGGLTLALQIFKNQYPRKFMHQLLSGQLDVDRLDYLKRDSFYTGVTEGNINTERILATMNVVDENLVFEIKGIHSLEKFLLARRLMYWQVYLHKTSLVAELLLVKALERARSLGSDAGFTNPNLALFFSTEKPIVFDESLLTAYLRLDDSDLMQQLKQWSHGSDSILKKLSLQLLQRNLLKIKIKDTPFLPAEIQNKKEATVPNLDTIAQDTFVFSGSVSNQTYVTDAQKIVLVDKAKKTISIERAIDYLDFDAFSKPQIKYYLCYPKQLFYL
ncbi:HD domain-containing protein [Flavobacteriaceae bacterium]|nr:HD domain-containing protein [Flavobacteriaceae bacterium]